MARPDIMIRVQDARLEAAFCSGGTVTFAVIKSDTASAVSEEAVLLSGEQVVPAGFVGYIPQDLPGLTVKRDTLAVSEVAGFGIEITIDKRLASGLFMLASDPDLWVDPDGGTHAKPCDD